MTEVAELIVIDQPNLTEGTMVMSFTGWMDGGDVSTGTVDWLVRKLSAQPVGEISPERFYLYSVPGSMEGAAALRPQVKIEDGVIASISPPANTFFCQPKSNLILFSGVEPSLNWEQFAQCLFTFARRSGVSTIYFVGSYAGVVPHTRQPRIFSTVSDARFKPVLARYGVAFSNYEGPGSFTSYMTARARQQGMQMASVVAEIPSYIQGPNPKAIAAVLRKLLPILGVQLNTEELTDLSDAWEQRVDEALGTKSELAEFVNKLETGYDKEMFDNQLGDLKAWLEDQGIRLE